MKEFMKKNKNKIIMLVVIIFLGIIYFSYNITLTWDSSEYLGLADYIGTQQMTEKWIGHRGIAFPLLLKLFKPFGIENKIFLLIMMFAFYIGMVLIIYQIYKKLKELEFFNKKRTVYFFIAYIIFTIILNPIIFGYYHTVLTEFVSMTITLLTCYLSWNWIKCSWNENKKSTIIYALVFSVLAIFIYHIKQSLVSLVLLPMIISGLISIINEFKKPNVLTKVGTIIFVGIMLLLSIEIWNFVMKDAGVAEDTDNKRVKGYLIYGVNKIKKVCDEQTISEAELNMEMISQKDKEEISKILSNESKYNEFRIYETANKNKYLVYYSKDNYSFKEDLNFYIKVLFNSPADIISSYYNSYWKMIFIKKNYPLWLTYENSIIPVRMYKNQENVIDVNVEYKDYVQNYRSINERNFVAKIFNKYVSKTIKFLTVYMKLSLWILPILWVLTIIAYIALRKKINKNILSILQFIIILYTTSFGAIMSYVVFSATVDRYVIPMVIPTFIANFLLVTLLYKIEIKRFRPIFMLNKRQ